MSRKVRFIHAADIHLGSILHVSNKADKKLSELFNNAVYDSFERLCDRALEEKADFILISGDIYDKEARSVRANSFFIEQCKRLEKQKISIFVIAGNHDPLKRNSELFTLPSNVRMFSEEQVETVEVKDEQGDIAVRIVGQSYKENWDSRKMYQNYIVPKDNILNIALLHTQLDGSNNYIPCTALDLKAIENIDYWALGHIHKCSMESFSEPVIAYPGIPQGRDFGEEGIGGALLVEVDDKVVSSIKYIPLTNFVWKKVFIKLGDLKERNPKNISDLENILTEKAEELLKGVEAMPENLSSIEIKENRSIKGYIIKWIISGRSELYNMLNERDEDIEQHLIQSLNSRFSKENTILYTDSVELTIGRPINDLDILKSENSAIREISNFTKQCLQDKSIKQQLIKSLGSLWEVAENSEDFNTKKLQLSEELLADILGQAELLVVDELLKRSEEQ